MKRRTVHICFAVVSLIAGGLAGYYGWHWQQARRLNADIATAVQSAAPPDPRTTAESQFAYALALARSGSTEVAIKAYQSLTLSERDDIKQVALYNLGNLYLREALKDGAAAATRYMPLIELAKQSYRTLLRLNSGDWDARHNLEQALRLAPESDESEEKDGAAILPKERDITNVQGQPMILP